MWDGLLNMKTQPFSRLGTLTAAGAFIRGGSTSYRVCLVGVLLCVSIPLLGACGPSKQAWHAQLAKQNELSWRAQNQQAELDRAKAEIARLNSELEKSRAAQPTGEPTDPAQMQALLASTKEQAALLERIKARFDALRERLKELTELGLEVTVRHNKMVISLPGDVLFAPGSAKLSKSGERVLAKVLAALLGDPALRERYYQVAGHTDNQPVVRTVEEFKDNWGLSLMRSREVLLFLTRVEGGPGLDVKRWSAAGYAETDPVATNATVEGRRRNRRVELVVQPNVEEMLDLKSLVQ